MRVLLLAVCALLVVGAMSPAFGQSPLGELARKEEERRKTVKSKGRVYTNSDLPYVPPAVRAPETTAAAAPADASDSSATPEAAGAGDAASEEEAPSPRRDQAYWSGRLTALRETLERNQTLADALQSRINALTTDFVNRDDPIQRAAIAADRDKAVAELERLRKQLVADEQAIRDLQDEARRAAVPPGWLR